MKQVENIEQQKSVKLDTASKLYIAAEAHIKSFNYFMDTGFQKICKHLNPLEIYAESIPLKDPNRKAASIPFDSMKIWIHDISIGNPTHSEDLTDKNTKKYPWECRMNGSSYCAPLLVTICRIQNDGTPEKRSINLGEIPVMIKSNHCNLNGLSPKEMVLKNEDCCEVGGYFVLNGLEKLLRLIQVPKKNYPYGKLYKLNNSYPKINIPYA